MGLFDLFKKSKKEEKRITGPIKCTIGEFMEIEKVLADKREFLDVVVFRYNGDVHRVGQMFNDTKIVFQKDGKTPAFVFDNDKYDSLEEICQFTILGNSTEFIELLGFGSDEINDPIDNIVYDEFYIDGEGAFWHLKDKYN